MSDYKACLKQVWFKEYLGWSYKNIVWDLNLTLSEILSLKYIIQVIIGSKQILNKIMNAKQLNYNSNKKLSQFIHVSFRPSKGENTNRLTFILFIW